MNMRWIVNFTLMIVVFGTILGLVLGGLNPWTNPAEANRINMETEHKQTMYTLEERLSTAKTEAEIQRIEQDMEMQAAQYEHDKKVLIQNLENRQIAFNTWMQVVTMLGGAFSIILVIATIMWLRSKYPVQPRVVLMANHAGNKAVPPVEMVIPNEAMPEYEENWHEDEFRKAKIDEARARERVERMQMLDEETALMQRMRAISNPAKIGNGKYNNLPLGV